MPKYLNYKELIKAVGIFTVRMKEIVLGIFNAIIY